MVQLQAWPTPPLDLPVVGCFTFLAHFQRNLFVPSFSENPACPSTLHPVLRELACKYVIALCSHFSPVLSLATKLVGGPAATTMALVSLIETSPIGALVPELSLSLPLVLQCAVSSSRTPEIAEMFTTTINAVRRILVHLDQFNAATLSRSPPESTLLFPAFKSAVGVSAGAGKELFLGCTPVGSRLAESNHPVHTSDVVFTVAMPGAAFLKVEFRGRVWVRGYEGTSVET